MKLTLQVGDFIVAVLIGCLAVGLFAFMTFGIVSDGQPTLVIVEDGVTKYQIPLDDQLNRTITIDGLYKNEITIKNGSVKITESNCPGADCTHSGWISNPGRGIICLPNRVEVKIIGLDIEIDGVVG